MTEKALNKEDLESYPSYIKPKTLGILLVVFLLVKALLAIVVPASSPTYASDLTTENIINAINEQRSLRDLTTLNTNSILTEAAQSKSDDMQARHYFAHVDPDGHYIWDKIVADGYTPYLELGENIAIEFYDTDSLINAWMNSPEHRANILNAGFVDQGMGLTFGDTTIGQYHSVIDNTFGTLAPVAKVKAAAPSTGQTSAPKPKPQTLGTTQTAAPSPATTTPLLTMPILTRSEQQIALNNPQSNFSVSSQSSPVSTSTTASSTNPKIVLPNSPTVVGSSENSILASYQANRYLVLLAGVILLLLMVSDIRKTVELKLGNVDKKVGNLVVLVISLIVIAFMYWL